MAEFAFFLITGGNECFCTTSVSRQQLCIGFRDPPADMIIITNDVIIPVSPTSIMNTDINLKNFAHEHPKLLWAVQTFIRR